MLGLAGRGGGQTPSGCRTSPCRSGWGFWESELQLTWSKCGQEGPAGCKGAKGGQRENNGHSSPLHVTASSNDEVSASSAQLKMSPGFLWEMARQRASLGFLQPEQQKNDSHSGPTSVLWAAQLRSPPRHPSRAQPGWVCSPSTEMSWHPLLQGQPWPCYR